MQLVGFGKKLFSREQSEDVLALQRLFEARNPFARPGDHAGELVRRLHLLILRTLARDGELHGFEIAESIERTSDSVLVVEEGSLYPALQRMLVNGWVTAEWRISEKNRRARVYELTADGRAQLASEIERFDRMVRAITLVLRTN